MLTLYVYQGCSTCRDAIKWLKARGIKFDERAIRETPPSIPELQAMLAAKEGNLRAIMNTSGMDYRALGLKDKLPRMSEDEVLKLLSKNGNLVKRPFAFDKRRGHLPHRLQGGGVESGAGLTKRSQLERRQIKPRLPLLSCSPPPAPLPLPRSA